MKTENSQQPEQLPKSTNDCEQIRDHSKLLKLPDSCETRQRGCLESIVRSEYECILNQSKMQILHDRIESLQEESEHLKKTNSLLQQRISFWEESQKDTLRELQEEQQKTVQYRESYQIQNEKLAQLQEEHDKELQLLKDQIKQKDNFIELIKIEHQKQLLRMEEQVQHLNKKIQFLMMEKPKGSGGTETIEIDLQSSDGEQESLFRVKKGTRFEASNGEHSEKQNLCLGNRQFELEDKARRFMRRDKEELKVMMKTLKNAQNCIRMGGHELTMIEAQKSMMGMTVLNGSSQASKRNSHSRFNKTYCN